jgi:hypothetical protein
MAEAGRAFDMKHNFDRALLNVVAIIQKEYDVCDDLLQGLHLKETEAYHGRMEKLSPVEEEVMKELNGVTQALSWVLYDDIENPYKTLRDRLPFSRDLENAIEMHQGTLTRVKEKEV